MNRVYKVTFSHDEPIDSGIIETYQPKIQFQLGELQRDYRYESSAMSDDIELIYQAIVEINQGYAADALLTMALAKTEIIDLVDHASMPYSVVIEPVLDDMTPYQYVKRAEEYKCYMQFTGSRPNGNYECIVKSKDLNSIYNFLREEYCGGNTEQALWHMTTIKGA